MKNLKIVDTCLNCQHVISMGDYDIETTFYCNVDKSCNYHLYGFHSETPEEYKKRMEWFDEHYVECNNICSYFKRRKW